MAAAGPADDRPARAGVLDAARSGVVDAQLPARRVAARGRHAAVRHWLLPLLEEGYLDGMHATVGVRVPFRYALVNGWYYNTPPIPSPTAAGARAGAEDAATQ